MFSARATLEVSQVSSGWLKLCAFAKVECMVVTLDVSQVFSGWLKLCAFAKVECMVVTLDVFHEEISPLNSGSFLKAYDMSVTYCTSQFGMVPKLVEVKPYVMHSPLTGASRVHALTAS